MEREPVAWIESPLQLLGAAEWAHAHGTVIDVACRLTTQVPETAAELSARRAPLGDMLPYFGIPWRLLARHRHWIVGDGFSGQFRLAASVLRPDRVTFLDDGANTLALADALTGRRPYARPGQTERGLTARFGPSALEHLRRRAHAGGVDLFTAFALGDERTAALGTLGVGVGAHGFGWLRDSAHSDRMRRAVGGDRLLLGSARPVDGHMPLPDYIAWVADEAAAEPVTYLPHRRETDEQLDLVSALPGVTVARLGLPVELVLAGAGRPLEVLSLATSATTTLSLLLEGTGSVLREKDGIVRRTGEPFADELPGRTASDETAAVGARELGGSGGAPTAAIDDAATAPADVVAVIPARGGSVGVPGKNLRRISGVPLVGRAVRSALDAGIDQVFVSTDDAEIAATATVHGAAVIERPAEIAGSTASSESALLHALDALAAQGVRPRVLVFLQATSPFIDAESLRIAVAGVREGNADCAFSAVESYGFLWRRGERGAEAVNHEVGYRPRRQDREPHFLETGAFYVLDVEGFLRARHRFFGRIEIVEVSERTAIEIDSEEQLEIARAMAPLIDRMRVRAGARRRFAHAIDA
ncbi:MULTISPECIES: acylneuraminate cytidylyltransferase family protein [unclassified Microbacterium]|uniref:acylneuraminate cytidylyltransferase family protein n=1 Tax=Microbacterium TaxID=33882 RepID=UPI003BA09441